MLEQPMKTTLYLGLELPQAIPGQRLVHLPVIKIVPRPPDDSSIVHLYTNLLSYTHLIFTSKQTVRIFFQYLPLFGRRLEDLKQLKVVVVGKATAKELEKQGLLEPVVADEETAEGVCQILFQELSVSCFFCWPHSALSRRVILDFLEHHCSRHFECVFYDTRYTEPDSLPPLDGIDEIVFTSPSTVDGFLQLYGVIPDDKAIKVQGAITKRHIIKKFPNCVVD